MRSAPLYALQLRSMASAVVVSIFAEIGVPLHVRQLPTVPQPVRNVPSRKIVESAALPPAPPLPPIPTFVPALPLAPPLPKLPAAPPDSLLAPAEPPLAMMSPPPPTVLVPPLDPGAPPVPAG